MREDLSEALAELRAVDGKEFKQLEKRRGTEGVEKAVPADERILWVQRLNHYSDDEGADISSLDYGVVAVTDRGLTFLGDARTLRVNHNEIAGVQFDRGGRGIFGRPSTLILRLKSSGKVAFRPRVQQQPSTDRLATILEEAWQTAQRASSTAPPVVSSSVADELRKLGDLHKSGAITDDEFKAAKTKLLN